MIWASEVKCEIGERMEGWKDGKEAAVMHTMRNRALDKIDPLSGPLEKEGKTALPYVH